MYVFIKAKFSEQISLMFLRTWNLKTLFLRTWKFSALLINWSFLRTIIFRLLDRKNFPISVFKNEELKTLAGFKNDNFPSENYVGIMKRSWSSEKFSALSISRRVLWGHQSRSKAYYFKTRPRTRVFALKFFLTKLEGCASKIFRLFGEIFRLFIDKWD